MVKSMKILLTGGSGFVGRNVKEYLEQKGYDIYAPTSLELNCLDEETVKKKLLAEKYDIVLHFAMYGSGIQKSIDETKLLEYNLKIFLNFARYSDLYGKMIYSGSGAEYDKRQPIHMVRENDLPRHTIPTDQYGLMKYIINSIVESSSNIYNLRLFGIFGKYENWKVRYISNICCKSIIGLPLTMRRNCYFDYLWIDDFCCMLEKFIKIDKPIFHTYNAVRGESIDLYKLAEIVNEISENPQRIIICQEGLANEYTANNDRILKEIPNMSFTDMKYAVRQLYLWYQTNIDTIDKYSLIYG